MEDIYLIIFYAATVAPTLLFVKETKKRLSEIKQCGGSLVWLPLTIGGLLAYVVFAMDVPVHVALALLPLGFLYKYIYQKRGLNQAYALHFATNMAVVGVSIGSYFLLLFPSSPQPFF